MKDPGSSRFKYFSDVTNSGMMVGQNRPVGRVSVSKNTINSFPTPRGTWRSWRKQTILPALETKANWPEKEVPNVLSISINRVLGNASATCEITLSNTAMTPPEVDDFGVGNPGYLTPDRGVMPKDSGVNFYTLQNEWQDLLRPNRVIHTYQGYGSDDDTKFDPLNPLYVPPYRDSRLQQTGVWLIDSVSFNSPNATITISCRDMGKLLVEQYTFPPIVDSGRWPLEYKPLSQATSGSGGTSLNLGRWHSSSNNGSNGIDHIIYGHKPSESMDGKTETYWLSQGHSSGTASDSFEWIQFDVGKQAFNEIAIHTARGGYKVYISYDAGDGAGWEGIVNIPYSPSGANNGSAIKYIKQATVGAMTSTIISVAGLQKNAKYVRLTFTSLSNFTELNDSLPYRVGIREVRISNKTTAVAGTTSNAGQPGVINDYTEIVKEMLAWGGFFDPALTPADPVVSYLDSSNNSKGACWADIEILGSGPKFPLPVTDFTSVSLMDVIKKVADIHGAIFFIDDTGAAIFRLPNTWHPGSYIVDPETATTRIRVVDHPFSFHESKNIISLSTIIDDSSLRSDFLVSGQGGGENGIPRGGYTPGFNTADPTDSSSVDDKSLLAGQIRVASISNAPVTTDLEAQRMAELLALEAHFTYRRAQVTAPCHPGLQLDDQVKLFDRITNSSYIYYVHGISSSMDLTTGEYTMSVQMFWLGDDPSRTWHFNVQEESAIIKYYTDAVAKWTAVINKQAGN